ncbi:MAG: SDR family oxidoreductase [Gammaproteobacteria bacterium]|nr:SDR family oxidoreductase [Gammaproteobacteria bacterium]
MNEQLLTDKVVVITGGAGLLGQVFAASVIAHGGTAVVADINLEAAKQAAEQIKQQSGVVKVHAIALDINSQASLTGAIVSLNKQFGKIDALVNNAYPRNKNYGRHFFDVEYADFCENLSINLGGYFLASQQFAQYFKQQGFGHIVNIASIYGVVAPRFDVYENTSMTTPVEYAAIKSGLLHLTRYMTKYFKGMNIRVNAISPGGIFDHQPEPFLKAYKRSCANKGMLDKEDLGGTLVYLLSDLSQYVNGQNITVDDGFSL